METKLRIEGGKFVGTAQLPPQTGGEKAIDVEVPAGTFETFRVEMSGGPMPMVLFVRKDAPHVLVKQEFAGAPVSIELQSM